MNDLDELRRSPRWLDAACARRNMGGRGGRRGGGGGRRSSPTNTQAPVLAGGTYAGSSPAITPGTWSGSPTLTYSLEVNGVAVASGSKATVEAYVYTLGDESLNATVYEIPNGNAGARVASNTVAIDLAAAIRAQLGGAEQLVLLARDADISLVSGKVATWADRSGKARSATQGTDAARPTWSTGAVNGRRGMTFAAAQLLSTAAYNLGSFDTVAALVLFVDTETAAKIVVERSASAATNNGGYYITANEVAGTLRFQGCANALLSSAQSSAETMASAKVVTGTWDQTLSTNETQIRVSGVNVTSVRPGNGDTSGGLGNHAMNIGARAGITSGLNGSIAAVIEAAWSGGLDAGRLAKVAAVESLLRGAWSV